MRWRNPIGQLEVVGIHSSINKERKRERKTSHSHLLSLSLSFCLSLSNSVFFLYPIFPFSPQFPTHFPSKFSNTASAMRDLAIKFRFEP